MKEVKFCSKCVESTERFIGSITFSDQKKDKKTVTNFEGNVCSGCKYYEYKKTINWEEREKELRELLDSYRKNDGSYDILIPGSGGKDSRFVTHILKEKYNMNPLTCTWAPHMYTDVGWRNFQSWINNGFDNILFTPNGKIHRKLTRLSFENLLHPFQPFAIGQSCYPIKVALQRNIKLIMYGDSQAEVGVGGNLFSFNDKQRHPLLFTYKDEKELFFGGYSINELEKFGIKKVDLIPYMPIKAEELEKKELHVAKLPYYLNYNPQSNFYYAMEHTGFEVNPMGRTEGTYTKYQSLDDKIDGLHFYTWFIKTGRGRATEDAALEVRNEIITREEAVSLVKKYDGEFPQIYFKEILNYLDLNEKKFFEIIDKFRPQHLWKKESGKWELLQAVWKNK